MNPNKAADEKAKKDPAHQTGESHGTIKGPQRTDHEPGERDLPQGSENQTGHKR